LNDDLLEPKSRPLLCHSSQAIRDEYHVACCANVDACNAHLSVELAPKAANKTDAGKKFLLSTASFWAIRTKVGDFRTKLGGFLIQLGVFDPMGRFLD
jgi:hypothetical protein